MKSVHLHPGVTNLFLVFFCFPGSILSISGNHPRKDLALIGDKFWENLSKLFLNLQKNCPKTNNYVEMWWNFSPKSFSPKSEANWSSSFAMQILFSAKTCHITTFKLKLKCAMHSMQKSHQICIFFRLSRCLLCVQMWSAVWWVKSSGLHTLSPLEIMLFPMCFPHTI
jgi:hypothetical protein